MMARYDVGGGGVLGGIRRRAEMIEWRKQNGSLVIRCCRLSCYLCSNRIILLMREEKNVSHEKSVSVNVM